MKAPSILIVEDESIIALDIKTVLQSLGYRISGIANSGEKALAILKKNPTDLVLMDIKIKGSMNGIETTKKINTLYKIPVIFLTAFADEETLKKIKEVDIYGFIVKPANRQTVQGTIELALYKHHMDYALRDREERLQHVNQVLRAIRLVHMLITKESDRNHLIQGTCDNLVETLSYHRACIALYDSENHFSTFAFTGPDQETRPVRRSLKGPVSDHPVCMRRAITHKQASVVVTSDDLCRTCPHKLADTDYSRFSRRLEYSGRIFGIMSVAVPKIYQDDKEELELFRELVDDVAFALYRIDLEDKKQSAEKLAQTREKTLTTLMNNLPGLAYRRRLDRQLTMIFLSGGCFKLTGFPNHDLIDNKNQSYIKLMHPDDRASVIQKIKDAVKDSRPFELIYRIITASKEEKWVWERGLHVETDKNGRQYLEGVIHDITEQKLAEAALIKSETRLRNIIEHSNEIFFIHNTSNQLKYVSPQSESIMGYTPDEMMLAWTDLTTDHPMNENGYNATMKAIETGQKQPAYPLQVKCKNGNAIFVEVDESPFINEKGEVIGMVGAVRDITARREAEEKLLELNARMQAILENTDQLIMIADKNGIPIMYNEAYSNTMKDLFNLDLKPGIKILSKINDPKIKKWRHQIHKKIQGGEKFIVEFPFKTPNGKMRYFEMFLHPIFDFGLFKGYTEFTRDITNRKEVEQALQTSESKLSETVAELEGVINALPGLVSVMDKDFNVLVANNAVIETFGQSKPEEVLFKKCYKVRKKRQTLCPQCGLKIAMETGRQITRVSTPEEEQMMGMATKSYAVPLKNKAGKIWGGVEVIMDISDLRQAEQTTRDSELKYRILTENVSDVIWTFDQNGKFLYVSPSVQNLIGYTVIEIKHKRMDSILTAESRKAVLQVYKQLKKDMKAGRIWKKSRILELEQRHKNGHTVTTESHISALYDENKQFKFFLGVTRDIGERKLHENLLSQKMDELKKFNQVMVGRETRMIELKHEVNALRDQLGMQKKYRIPAINKQ